MHSHHDDQTATITFAGTATVAGCVSTGQSLSIRIAIANTTRLDPRGRARTGVQGLQPRGKASFLSSQPLPAIIQILKSQIF